MRLLFLISALLPALLYAAVPQPVRDSAFDWRCLNPDGTASNHQRQDTAIFACQVRADANPGQAYFIEGGRYLVLVEPVVAPEPIPEPEPTPEPEPEPTPDPVPSDGYTLSDIGPVPFAYSTPIPPTTTSEVTVTPATLGAHASVDGVQITLSAGDYGDVNFAGNDQRVIISSGVAIANLRASGTRQTIEMVPARGATVENISSFGGTDRLFLNIFQQSPTDEPNYQYENYFSTTRLAIVGSYLDSVGHSAFMGAGGFSDVVIANTYVNQHRLGDGQSATQAGPRIHNVSRVVIVDSRMRNLGRQSLRLHTPQSNGDMIDVFVSRNEFVGSGIQVRPNSGAGVGSGVEMRDIWLTDNTWHHDRNVVIRFGGGNVDAGQTDPQPQNVVYTGNRLYSSQGFPGEAAGNGWTVSDNVRLGPYEAPAEWVWQ